MSATDELSRLLDERGVEYDGSFGVTEFYGEDGSAIVACNSKSKDKDGVLYVHAYLTPEQAVEATLGSDLKAENAKLRELVRELFDYVCDSEPCCSVCRYCGEDDECALCDRMRELGVEV